MSMPKTRVRIAMLGSGFVAGFYMQGLANVAGQEVVANYSRKKHRARKFAQEWSIPEPTTDLNKLIERDDIDLYIIAVPNEEHLPVSLALSRAKRNQVCTKPLARTPQEAHAMLRAARRSGALHGYAETEVFSPCVVKARQIVAKGGISNPSPPPTSHLRRPSTIASEPSGKPKGSRSHLAGKTLATAISVSGMCLLFVAVNSGSCERLKDDPTLQLHQTIRRAALSASLV
jgi:hypothetical protein